MMVFMTFIGFLGLRKESVLDDPNGYARFPLGLANAVPRLYSGIQVHLHRFRTPSPSRRGLATVCPVDFRTGLMGPWAALQVPLLAASGCS